MFRYSEELNECRKAMKNIINYYFYGTVKDTNWKLDTIGAFKARNYTITFFKKQINCVWGKKHLSTEIKKKNKKIIIFMFSPMAVVFRLKIVRKDSTQLFFYRFFV